MNRLAYSLLVLLAWTSLSWGQGQLINGHRTMTGGLNTGTTTGSANAYVLTLNPALPGYVTWQCFTFLANHANTGPATLNVNGRGARAIKKWVGGVLADVGVVTTVPDIMPGQYVHVCYDGTAMQVQSGSGSSGTGGTGGGHNIQDETTPLAPQPILNFTGDGVLCTNNAGAGRTDCVITGTAVPYTPENVANKATATGLGTSNLLYPTQNAVKSYVDTGLATKQATLLYTPENVANKSTATGLGTSDLLYPSQQAVKTYVDTGLALRVPQSRTLTPGFGMQAIGDLSANRTIAFIAPSSASQVYVSNSPTAGTWRSLPPCEDTGGQHLNFSITAQAFTCGTSGGGGGGTTLSDGAGVQIVGSTLSTASREPGFLASAVADLPEGGGASGALQTWADGSLEYIDGAALATRRRGFLLPSPYTWNLTACAGTASTCKLTLNGTQVVTGTDLEGAGGGGSGDITTVGNVTGGDVGTSGAPLTALSWGGLPVPSPPPTGQGLQFMYDAAKNFCLITDDGAVKCGSQVIAPTQHFFLTGRAADGSFSAARPSIASLSDGATLARLAGPQTFTGTYIVPRPCTLGASSGNLTPNLNVCDYIERHDVSGAVAMQTPTLTGSPDNGRIFTLSFFAASPQALTWSTAYAGNYRQTLPATLPGGAYMGLSFRYNGTTTKYELWAAHDANPIMNSLRLQGTASGIVTIKPFANAGTYNLNLPTSAGLAGELLTSQGGVENLMTWTASTSANTPSSLVARDSLGNFSAGTITAALSGNATTATTAITATSATTAGALSAPLPLGDLADATAAARLLCRGGAAGAGEWQECTLGTNVSMAGQVLNATGGGGSLGTGTIQLSVVGLKLAPTNTATPDVNETNDRLRFDASTEECGIWQGAVPADYTGSLVAKLNYSMTSATSGGIAAGFAVLAVTSGDAVDANLATYDTENVCTDTVPGTVGYMKLLSCTLTTVDSAASRDLFRVKLCRKIAHASDTATGDLEALTLTVEYAR